MVSCDRAGREVACKLNDAPKTADHFGQLFGTQVPVRLGFDEKKRVDMAIYHVSIIGYARFDEVEKFTKIVRDECDESSKPMVAPTSRNWQLLR